MLRFVALIDAAGSLFPSLHLEDEPFKTRRSLQRQDRCVGVCVVVLKSQLDALAIEGVWIGLNLHVLFKQPIDCLLGFMQLDRKC